MNSFSIKMESDYTLDLQLSLDSFDTRFLTDFLITPKSYLEEQVGSCLSSGLACFHTICGTCFLVLHSRNKSVHDNFLYK